MRSGLHSGITLVQGDHSIDAKKDIPRNVDDGQTPVEVDRVGSVYWDPAQKAENYDVVDKLHHVDVV